MPYCGFDISIALYHIIKGNSRNRQLFFDVVIICFFVCFCFEEARAKGLFIRGFFRIFCWLIILVGQKNLPFQCFSAWSLNLILDQFWNTEHQLVFLSHSGLVQP